MPYTFSSVILSLVLTIVIYCIFPLLFATVRRKEISSRKYIVLCFAVNLLIHIMLFSWFSRSSPAPCFLWTSVFAAIGRKIMGNKAILRESNSVQDAEQNAISDTVAPSSDTIEGKTPSDTVQNVQHHSLHGKRFIRIFAALIGVVLLVALLGLYAQSQQQISQLNQLVSDLELSKTAQDQNIEQLERKIEDQAAEIRLLNQAKTRMTDKISDLESEIEFYDRYVVFVCDDNTGWYHKYDCMVFQATRASFWAYNIDAAISEGFDPCFYCNK